MKKILPWFVIILAAVSAVAATRGTPEEAKALLAKAVEHFKKAGRAQALADFNSGKAPWKERDLYVFCADPTGVEIVNAGFPSMVGTSANEINDIHGVPLGKAAWKAVANDGAGSIEYDWTNPVTHRTERKISFVQKVDADVLCGVGAYKPR